MIAEIISRAIEYDKGDPKRIQHFLKVHAFAKTIGTLEKMDAEALQILEMAAVLHDIGIHLSEQKYGSSAGPYQEKEGPAVAREILHEFSLSEAAMQRVCYLIRHHHTYSQIDGLDYQILVEADFLVNIYEDSLNNVQIESICHKIFKTSTGTSFLKEIFLQNY